MKKSYIKCCVIFLLASLFSAAQAGCALLPKTPSETPVQQTALPESATPEPTDAFQTELPTFPPMPKLGNLVGGAILPEGIEYFVLDGESNLRYIYDKYGELVKVIAVEDEGEYSNWNTTGFYGEHGVPFGYSIEKGEFIPEYSMFGAMALNIEYDYNEESGRSSYFLREIRDVNFENPIDFRDRNIDLGLGGSVFMIDGKYLVLYANLSGYIEGPVEESPYSLTLYDENGRELKSVDPKPFNIIKGVFAEKYIYAAKAVLNQQGQWEGEYEYSIYTLDGELVMRDIELVRKDYFYVDWELSIGYAIGDYIQDKSGNIYNGELQKIDELPEDAERSPSDVYFSQTVEGYACGSIGYYCGVWERGEYYVDVVRWLFKIYSPYLANDGYEDDRYY